MVVYKTINLYTFFKAYLAMEKTNLSTQLRTHSCNDITEKDIKKEVKLCGWVHSRRDHGGIMLIDLRDK